MHGIPGFEVEGEGIVTRVPLKKRDAVRIAAGEYGLDATSAKRLGTERDDSFALKTTAGRFVLKVAHPADDPAEIDFQTSALEHVREADASLPLQRVVPSRTGEIATTLAVHDGRIARLFEWLPGELMYRSPPNDEQLVQVAEALGRLTIALQDFEHPNSTRPFAWDLAQFPRLRQLLERFPDDDIAEVFRRFDSIVQPRLDELPRQVIHNDFNSGNVLVDPTDPEFVTGILDFGDAIRTIRIADLAVALSYQLYPSDRDWTDVRPFIEAYQARVPLVGPEPEVLKTLVEARFAQRILMNEWLSQDEDDGGRDDKFRAGVRAELARLLEEN